MCFQIQIEHEHRFSIYENMNYYRNIEVFMSCLQIHKLWYIDEK